MNVSQSKLTESQSTIGDESILESVARIKVLSDEIIMAHGHNTTKPSTINQKSISNFNWMFPEVAKRENASGTGYLCDDDEGRDEEFQNG